MISVNIDDYRFQLRAAAVIVHDGFVLLQRSDGYKNWILPGGRVDAGEDAKSTLTREMEEELSERVECEELLSVVENFFKHAGKPNHEIGLYFRAKLDQESRLLDKSRSHTGVEGDSALEFRWFLIDQLHEIDLEPSSLRALLSRPVLRFEHIVQRE